MMMGAAATSGSLTVTLPSTLTASRSTTTPTNASASIQLSDTGDINRITAGTTDLGDWIAPKTGMGNYEALFHPTSGTLSSGAADTWENLGTARTYNVTQAGIGSKTCIGTLSIRAGSTVLTTSTVTLSADVSF